MRLIYKYIILLLFSLVGASSGMEAINVPEVYKKFRDTDTRKLMSYGAHYDTVNQPDSALVCYTLVVERLNSEKLSTEEEQIYSRALTNLGFLYASYYFDYPKALSCLNRSLEASKKAGYFSNVAYNYVNIAGVYLACNQIYGNGLFEDEIWDYCSRGLEMAMRSGEPEVAFGCVVNAGVINFQKKQPEKFLAMARKLRSMKIPQDLYMREFYLTFISGCELYSTGDNEGALQQFSLLDKKVKADAMQAPRYYILAHTSMAFTLAALGRYDEAIEQTRLYMAEARKAGLEDEVAKGNFYLSEYFRALDNFNESSQNLLDYYSKKDSILSAREIANIGNMPLNFQINQLSALIQEERESKQRMRIIILIVVPFLLLLSFYVILLIRSRAKQRRYTKEIYRKNVELLREEEDARKRIQSLEEELQLLRDQASSAAEAEPAEASLRYKNSLIPEEQEMIILKKVNEILEDTSLICEPGFNLMQLSELVGFTYKQVSQVINDKTGNNFKTILTERRIKEACRRLLDVEHYGNYTIEHIAHSVGFQSRSHFSSSFKAVVGISPSDFQRNALAGGKTR